MAEPKQKTPKKTKETAPKAKKPAKKSRKSSLKPVPLLIETAFTVSKVVVIAFGVIVAFVSLSAGNGLLTVSIQAIVAMIVTGLMAWLIVWMLIRGSMDSLISEIKQAKQAEPESTKDFTA